MITVDEYQAWTKRFDNHKGPVQVLALALGLAAEAGEVANLFERRCREGAAPLDLAKVEEELGDVLWNVARIAAELNMTLPQIWTTNIAKLTKRFADNLVSGSGNSTA
jgi:NTP pyrophosphatase (non-canonical NTP hydrolase)